MHVNSFISPLVSGIDYYFKNLQCGFEIRLQKKVGNVLSEISVQNTENVVRNLMSEIQMSEI